MMESVLGFYFFKVKFECCGTNFIFDLRVQHNHHKCSTVFRVREEAGEPGKNLDTGEHAKPTQKDPTSAKFAAMLMLLIGFPIRFGTGAPSTASLPAKLCFVFLSFLNCQV